MPRHSTGIFLLNYNIGSTATKALVMHTSQTDADWYAELRGHDADNLAPMTVFVLGIFPLFILMREVYNKAILG